MRDFGPRPTLGELQRIDQGGGKRRGFITDRGLVLFAGKRQCKSSRGRVIRVRVSLLGMLSKVFNNYVFNLVQANAPARASDMHPIKHITHPRDVRKAMRLFPCIGRIIATLKQGIA
jgi:hypothetical protein